MLDGIRELELGSWMLKEPGTPIAEGIIRFHHDIMCVMVGVVGFVGWMLLRGLYLYRGGESDGVVHGTWLEIVWTTIPGVVLGIIAVPSFSLLYAVEEIVKPEMTVKVIGHQWYWSYEYTKSCVGGDVEEVSFDGYMLPEDELEIGELRLLEVDNRVILPVETNIRVIITSGDVLHSWAVPGLGIKVDACPGRLNEISMLIKREGTYYGQCSELCGVNHAFMPIGIEVVEKESYVDWLLNY